MQIASIQWRSENSAFFAYAKYFLLVFGQVPKKIRISDRSPKKSELPRELPPPPQGRNAGYATERIRTVHELRFTELRTDYRLIWNITRHSCGCVRMNFINNQYGPVLLLNTTLNSYSNPKHTFGSTRNFHGNRTAFLVIRTTRISYIRHHKLYRERLKPHTFRFLSRCLRMATAFLIR